MEPMEPALYRRNSFPPPPPYFPNPKTTKLSWAWKDPPEDNIFVEFYMNTSVHGLKYLGQQKRHFTERIFWLVAFLASTVTAAFFIWGLWSDYKNSPIVTVFHSSEKTLDQISFPSVTICNMNIYRKSVYNFYANEFYANRNHPSLLTGNWSAEMLSFYAKLVDVTYVCDSSVTTFKQFFDSSSNGKIQQAWKEQDESFILEKVDELLDPKNTLYNASQPCSNMILGCIWKTKITNCTDLFQAIVTDFGYCCTFNTIPESLLFNNIKANAKQNAKIVDKWKQVDLTTGLEYQNLLFSKSIEDVNRTIPHRQKYPGRMAGLTVILQPDLDEYHECTNTDSQGYIMGINTPLDFPRIKDAGLAIATNAEVFVGIRPEITMSDSAIKKFSVKTRECYYGNELKLTHYTKYTLSNCMDECIARVLMKRCKCVRYYMPRNDNDSTAFCKPSQYKCANKHENHIRKAGLESKCPECLPTCTEIDFRREVTTSNIQSERAKSFAESNLKLNFTGNMSIVHVYFDTDSVYPRLRKQQTTMIELISNAGGLLGLFMGFSVLSLLELVYYATMRPCFSYFRERAVKKLKGSNINQDESSSMGGPDTVDMRQPWFFKMMTNPRIGDSITQKGDMRITSKEQHKRNDDILITKLG